MKADTPREPFFVHCKCGYEWAPAFLPMEARLFVRVLKSARCPSCGADSKSLIQGEKPKPTSDGDARAWVGNGDTGTSSLTIWSVLTGYPSPHGRYDVPHDPDDFGRCYRLLQVMPLWRSRLVEVVEKCHDWTPFVDAWDELTALYEEELPNRIAPKLYARMQELRRA